MLEWALTAAAVLSFAYAVRVLFLSSKDRDAAREKLGCGFAIVATGLWIYVLNGRIGELLPAIRIALGLVLVLPAVQALADPARARILRALGGLVLGILLAGPALRDLWHAYGPDTRPPELRQADERVEEVRTLARRLRERQQNLQTLREELQAEVRSHGDSWEELESNERALEALGVLARVEQELERVDEGLVRLRIALDELEAQREEALARSESPELAEHPDLLALRRELEEAPSLEEMSILERHAMTKELRALYEREF